MTSESLQEIASRIARENPSFVETSAEPPPLPQFPARSQAPTFGADSWDGFLFLPSFRETFEFLCLANQPETAYKYLDALIIYGTEGRDIADDPLVSASLAPAKRVIDKYREKYRKKKKSATQT